MHQTGKFFIYNRVQPKDIVASEHKITPSRSARSGTIRFGITRTSEWSQSVSPLQVYDLIIFLGEILTTRDNRFQIYDGKGKRSTIKSLGSHFKGRKQKGGHCKAFLLLMGSSEHRSRRSYSRTPESKIWI